MLLLAALTCCLYGQQELRFEVASIKPHPDGPASFTGGGSPSGPHLKLGAMGIYSLIWWAYNVKPWQISGGPSWAQDGSGARRFDIEAKAEGDGARPVVEFRAMLRALLAERFHLVVHTETRDTRVYALMIDKGRIKLHESEAGARSQFTLGAGKLIARSMPVTLLVDYFSNRNGVDGPVVDRTGLSGKYDFTLEYSIPRPDNAVDPAPDIFAALPQQLGLRLVLQRAPVEYLVIDRAEMPSEN